MDKDLIIWLKSGQTMKFEKVTDFSLLGNSIGFNYFGVSTQKQRKATFYKDNIAGYALESKGV